MRSAVGCQLTPSLLQHGAVLFRDCRDLRVVGIPGIQWKTQQCDTQYETQYEGYSTRGSSRGPSRAVGEPEGGISSAEDFGLVVRAMGCEGYDYVGGAAPRTEVVKGGGGGWGRAPTSAPSLLLTRRHASTGIVFTSNESPPDQPIPFHHELAWRASTACIFCILRILLFRVKRHDSQGSPRHHPTTYSFVAKSSPNMEARRPSSHRPLCQHWVMLSTAKGQAAAFLAHDDMCWPRG